MNLKELENPSLSRDERARVRCRAAAELIHVGQYEQAQEALGELWQGVGERPIIENLSLVAGAEVLLQCGVLSGYLGAIKPVPVQERAKDLISEALRIFQNKRLKEKVSEAQYELGICYWREGAYEEARIILSEALAGAKDELRAKILIRQTIVETFAGRYHDALEILRQAQEFFESCNDVLKGKWHGQMGLVLQRLALTEGREDYADRAIIEFTAAIYHYEQAGNTRYAARNLNNLAMLLYPMERFQEAHESLDKAEDIFRNDPGSLAQVRETRARVLVAEQRYEEAKKVIDTTISVLEGTREQALLADALTVEGLVVGRLGDHERSILILRRAIEIAESSGSHYNAGFAALTLIEEHHERLSEIDLHKLYVRTDRLLRDTEDAEGINRLRACALLVMNRLLGPQLTDKGFNLTKVVRTYEAKFIEQALEMTGGLVSRAAKLLGFKHHGSLTNLLKKKHRHLQKKRIPPTPRKAVIRHRGGRGEYRSKGITILHVEDHRVVADAVKDTLEMEGWRVVTCFDGAVALNKLATQTPYDLLIVDNHLPNVNGIEIVRYARRLPHRKDTPVIMFSASDVQRDAREVGVDVYLKKPEDVKRLVEVVSSLTVLKAGGGEG
jgi:CheY-like chemotaxis protein/tetratricopeptide (TPR) repeat protein